MWLARGVGGLSPRERGRGGFVLVAAKKRTEE